MKTILIIGVGVLCIGAMIVLDVFITRDLEKPAKVKKNSEEVKKDQKV